MAGGGGGQYELNLTPYIDLMSTLIVFLLMTAVWNQIAVLSTDSSSTTASDSPAQPDPNRVTLSVTIMPGYIEMAENQQTKRIPHIEGKVDRSRFAEALKDWKARFPTRNDVILNTENTVTYQMLISTFDELVGNDFPDVGVSTQ